jgi:Peptidase inhibitor I78 family
MFVALTQAACGSLSRGGTSSAGMGPARCTAANAKQFLGQEMDAHNVDDARAYAGALRSRVIRPGEPVTMDVDPLRLNVELDQNGRIHRLRCG